MLLSGCSVSETAKSDKYDRAMATIGDQYFAFDIDNYNRIDNACVILYLELEQCCIPKMLVYIIVILNKCKE